MAPTTTSFIGGKLNLKGGNNKKSKSKKKKSKKSKHRLSSSSSSDDKAAEVAKIPPPPPSINNNNTESFDSESEYNDDDYDDGMTNAERKSLKFKNQRELKDLEKQARNSHRERVERLNAHLGSLTEHNDIPRVSAAGNG